MNRIKVLILADVRGWIVDRITDKMIEKIPCDFIKKYYTEISTDEIINIGNSCNLVHYQNWDIERHKEIINKLSVPLLVSCRSHRFPPSFIETAKNVNLHVVSPQLKEIFPFATYIPDGIFFNPKRFIVGFAGKRDDYKGFNIIKQACLELGVDFVPAVNIPPDQMENYYSVVDMVVIASENEGFNTVAMECMALNKPFITTDVGIPHYLDCFKVERSVEGIKKGILMFYKSWQIKEYSWDNVCQKFYSLYLDIIKKNDNKK